MSNRLDAKDVARLFKVSVPLVYKWAESGRLPSIRIECPGDGVKKTRHIVRFKLEDVLRFENEYYRN